MKRQIMTHATKNVQGWNTPVPYDEDYLNEYIQYFIQIESFSKYQYM